MTDTEPSAFIPPLRNRSVWALFVGGGMHGARRLMEADLHGQPRAYLEAYENAPAPLIFPPPEAISPAAVKVTYKHRVVDGQHVYEVQR